MAKKKQGHLPGMEPPKNKDLERLAEAYVDLRDQRIALLKQEIGKRELLAIKMKDLGLKTYEYDGRIVEVVGVEKVKVRSAKGDDDEGEED